MLIALLEAFRSIFFSLIIYLVSQENAGFRVQQNPSAFKYAFKILPSESYVFFFFGSKVLLNHVLPSLYMHSLLRGIKFIWFQQKLTPFPTNVMIYSYTYWGSIYFKCSQPRQFFHEMLSFSIIHNQFMSHPQLPPQN